MSLIQAEQTIAELQQAIRTAGAEYERRIEGLKADLGLAVELRAQLLGGLDTEKILLASHVIYARGACHPEYPTFHEIVAAARAEVLAGGGLLFGGYLGAKDYDRWVWQRCDCRYGYGPRHGNVVFEIGLTRPIRERQDKKLTADEIDACLYWLGNVEKVQAAEREGNAAKGGK